MADMKKNYDNLIIINLYNQTFGKINEYQIEHSRVKIPDELIMSRFCANIRIALVIEF